MADGREDNTCENDIKRVKRVNDICTEGADQPAHQLQTVDLLFAD